MAVFFVGEVNRLVNLVNDRDLCLFFLCQVRLLFDYRIYCSECPFSKSGKFYPLPVLFLGRQLFQVKTYRFYSSEFNR